MWVIIQYFPLSNLKLIRINNCLYNLNIYHNYVVGHTKLFDLIDKYLINLY